VTSRGSRKYNPRDGPLLEEEPGARRPERTERRQPSRQLPQQKDRSSASDVAPPAASSRRRAGNRIAHTHVSGFVQPTGSCLNMQTTDTSEESVTMYQTTRHRIPADSNLNIFCYYTSFYVCVPSLLCSPEVLQYRFCTHFFLRHGCYHSRRTHLY
jgi:hypothetical protein